MNRLEQRYRRALRLLPESYRRRWEEDMVAVFMATMHTDDPEEAQFQADYGRPPWPEVASVAWLALRLRIATPGAPWSAPVRLAVLCALLSHAAVAVDQAAFQLWLAGHLTLLPAPPPDWTAGLPTGLLPIAQNASALVWIVAFAALVSGHWRAARLLAAAGTVVPAVYALVPAPFVATRWSGVILDVLLIVAMASFEPDPRPSRRSWLVALPVAATAAAAFMLAAPFVQTPALLDWPALWCTGVLIGVAVHVVSGPARRPAWTQALTLLAVVALTLRLVTLLDYIGVPGDALLVGFAEAAAVLAVLLPLRRPSRSRVARS